MTFAQAPGSTSLELKLVVVRRLGYGRTVLRRSASLLALLAVIAAPAVTSTRLFCRYTGEEIIGCAESTAPERAEIRVNGCCEQRTFHALDGVRPLEDQRQQAPAPVAIDAPPMLVSNAIAVASPAVPLTTRPFARPPAFLSHRALLI